MKKLAFLLIILFVIYTISLQAKPKILGGVSTGAMNKNYYGSMLENGNQNLYSVNRFYNIGGVYVNPKFTLKTLNKNHSIGLGIPVTIIGARRTNINTSSNNSNSNLRLGLELPVSIDLNGGILTNNKKRGLGYFAGLGMAYTNVFSRNSEYSYKTLVSSVPSGNKTYNLDLNEAPNKYVLGFYWNLGGYVKMKNIFRPAKTWTLGLFVSSIYGFNGNNSGRLGLIL